MVSGCCQRPPNLAVTYRVFEILDDRRELDSAPDTARVRQRFLSRENALRLLFRIINYVRVGFVVGSRVQSSNIARLGPSDGRKTVAQHETPVVYIYLDRSGIESLFAQMPETIARASRLVDDEYLSFVKR
jgi:hypothetical protein